MKSKKNKLNLSSNNNFNFSYSFALIQIYLQYRDITDSNKLLLKSCLVVQDKYSKKWMLPGGKIEENENPFNATLRETKEESGIDLNNIDGFLDDRIFFHSKNLSGNLASFYIGHVKNNYINDNNYRKQLFNNRTTKNETTDFGYAIILNDKILIVSFYGKLKKEQSIKTGALKPILTFLYS